MTRVQTVMNKLATRFQPEAAEGLVAVFQIRIEDDQPYIIAVDENCCRIESGEHPDPNVTLYMDSETFVDIIDGDLGGTMAFMSGRLRAEGDVLLGSRLSKLFKR
jgi:putative sterol carrier protein